MKTILVPTDFSESARNATMYAASLAEELDYRLQLLHVYNLPISPPGEVPGALMVDVVELEKDVNDRLRIEAQKLAGKTKAQVSIKTASGFVVNEVLEAERKERPDLIAMGIHEEGPISEFIFGSATTDLLEKISTPLLIVPQGARYKGISQVAFADDFETDKPLHIPPQVKEWFNKFSSMIHVVRVVKGMDENKVTKSTDQRVEQHFADIVHDYHVVESSDVSEGLRYFVQQHKIDLLAMQPHTHGFLQNLFRESTTKKMAFHSPVPVLALPAQAAGE